MRGGWRLIAWIFPAVPGALTVAFLSWGAWRTGVNPHWLDGSRGWWLAALRPNQNWNLLGALGLWTAGLASFWWPRRHERVPILLIIVLVMVVVAAVLGTASYAPCRNGMSATGLVFWVLQLYVGQPPSLYQNTSDTAACMGVPPPALQLAQLIGLGATLIGAVAVATVLWREPVQRLQSRFTPRATVFTGLDTLTLPLLRRLAATSKYPRAIVVIEPDESNPLLDEARGCGARVIMGDPASPDLLRPIISGWGGRCALDRLYALSARVPENEAVLWTVNKLLARYRPAADRQVHLVTRIDDPRHADAWRGRHSRTDGRWFEDALSPAETTARTLVSRVLDTTQRFVLICGDGSLTLAILTDFARRSWEQATLIKAAAHGRLAGPAAFPPGAQPVPLAVERVTLLDVRAEQIRREFRQSTPKDILKAAPRVEVAAGQWRDQLLGKLDSMTAVEARRTAVIIVDGPDEESAHEAGRVARLHQHTPVFVLAARGAGMRETIFDRLLPFELELLMDDGAVPDDSWTRIARHWHEFYRLSHPVAPGAKGADKRLPWKQLAPDLQSDNILQVRSILKLVSELHREWVPIRMVPSGSHVELAATEIAVVASKEHERWLDRQKPADRDANPNAKPWDELTGKQRKSSCESVTDQLEQLAAVGFLPTIPRGGPDGAASFERTGTVRARRLTARMPWRPRPGEELHGKPGDWHVVDAAGNERTVADPEFQVSHEDLGNGQWRRVGTFRAWRVSEDQVVRTKEGKVTAKAGCWIVEGPGGERWPVGQDQFHHTYRPVTDPARPDQAMTPAATSSTTAATDST